MALPRKGARTIVVDGTQYRWMIRRKGTYSQGNIWSRMTIAVELADAGRSVLHVKLHAPRPDNFLGQPSISVTPAVVAGAIRRALSSGWKPDAPGAAFPLDAGEEPPTTCA
jgi:hypothetical protein